MHAGVALFSQRTCSAARTRDQTTTQAQLSAFNTGITSEKKQLEACRQSAGHEEEQIKTQGSESGPRSRRGDTQGCAISLRQRLPGSRTIAGKTPGAARRGSSAEAGVFCDTASDRYGAAIDVRKRAHVCNADQCQAKGLQFIPLVAEACGPPVLAATWVLLAAISGEFCFD